MDNKNSSRWTWTTGRPTSRKSKRPSRTSQNNYSSQTRLIGSMPLPNLKSKKAGAARHLSSNSLVISTGAKSSTSSRHTKHIRKAKRKPSFSPALVSELSLTPPAQQIDLVLAAASSALEIVRKSDVLKKSGSRFIPPLSNISNREEQPVLVSGRAPQKKTRNQRTFSHSDNCSPFFQVRSGSTSLVQPNQQPLKSAILSSQKVFKHKKIATQIL